MKLWGRLAGRPLLASLPLLGLATAIFAIWLIGARDPGYPLRIPKVKKGDWITYRVNQGFIKETATRIEKVKDDIIVHYRREVLDDGGKAIKSAEEKYTLSRNLTRKKIVDDRQANPELTRLLGAMTERRTVEIGGKRVDVFVEIITIPFRVEIWSSDEISLNGQVGEFLPTRDGKNEVMKMAVDFGHEP